MQSEFWLNLALGLFVEVLSTLTALVVREKKGQSVVILGLGTMLALFVGFGMKESFIKSFSINEEPTPSLTTSTPIKELPAPSPSIFIPTEEPTPSPTSSAFTKESTPSSSVSDSSAPSDYITPEKFIEEYYGNRNYNATWLMLSDHFKRKYHDYDESGSNFNFSSYKTWWEKVEKVEILSQDLIDGNHSAVQVTVTLRYFYKEDDLAPDVRKHTLDLIANDSSWLIDDQKL